MNFKKMYRRVLKSPLSHFADKSKLSTQLKIPHLRVGGNLVISDRDFSEMVIIIRW